MTEQEIRDKVGNQNYFNIGAYEARDKLQEVAPEGWKAFVKVLNSDEIPEGAIRVGQVKVRDGDPSFPLYLYPIPEPDSSPEEKHYPAYTLRLKPFTREQICEQADENGYLSGTVAVDPHDLIDGNYEGFLDLISERLIDSVLLMDIQFMFVGFDKGMLHVTVQGCVDMQEFEENE